MGFEVTDKLQLSLSSNNELLVKILSAHQSMIEKETLCTLGTKNEGNAKEVELDEGFMISLTLTK